MPKLLLLCTVWLIGSSCKFQTNLSPNHRLLPAISTPKNQKVLEESYEFLKNKTAFDALVAIKNDSILASWGEVDLPINTHSARKSIMSILYGIAIEKGFLKLNQTLAELKIDDKKVPLTELEKSCTIRDLLMSRSGIYIEASGETQEMKDSRPKRGQHQPGEFFYYNNWGFNVLGTIFEQQTQLTIGQAMEEWLAKPLGMKHFKANFVEYKKEDYTEHRQYVIYISAEDLARIGMMMANGGRWQGKQIVRESWVNESTKPYSKDAGGNEPLDMYSYLWWNDTKNQTFWATGWGGQFLTVDVKNKLVVVSRNDTGRSFIGQGLFLWKGKQGFRSHHQKLYEMMRDISL
jgi:CubicO group peptidase (beta-lactamase class C family)